MDRLAGSDGGPLPSLLAWLNFGRRALPLAQGFGRLAAQKRWPRSCFCDLRRATRVGGGTMLGFLLGTAIQYALAAAMLGVALAAWAWG